MTAPDWKSKIAPELRPIYRLAPNFTIGPWSTRVLRLLERLVPAKPRLPEGLSFREQQLGEQHLRLFYPSAGPSTPAALMWIHGGGRIVGRSVFMDPHCQRVTRELGILTAAASYRLAPEHPFPAALDDLTAAWSWMVEHAQALGIDPERIAIGGESAGGGLAAELCQRLRDTGGIQPCAQILVYPMLDDRTAIDPELTALRHLVWSNTSNHYGWSSYLGAKLGANSIEPHAAAARCEDLSGLPPAWLTIGELDLFLTETEAYVERLEQAGVQTELHSMLGGFHAYFTLGTHEPPILRMWDSLFAFLRARL